jgi:hypothetical protein
MKNRALHLTLIAVLLLSAASACGGSKSSTKPGTTSTTGTTTPQPTFKATLTATSHHPVVNNTHWFVTVTVSDLSGKPIAATLVMNVLFSGNQVGQIDNGKIYHFVGRHHEAITWPVDSLGYPLTLEAVVTVKGKTQKLLWPIKVVRK